LRKSRNLTATGLNNNMPRMHTAISGFSHRLMLFSSFMIQPQRLSTWPSTRAIFALTTVRLGERH